LALEIAATPSGCDDDRMSSLWNARADVTMAECEPVDKFRGCDRSVGGKPGEKFFDE
jgi:hypothetical protein